MSFRRSAAQADDGIDIARTREWIRAGRKLRIDYRDEGGKVSARVIWPIIIGFFDDRRTLAAWCELRQAFRHFRCDRIMAADFLDERYDAAPGALRQHWRKSVIDAVAK